MLNRKAFTIPFTNSWPSAMIYFILLSIDKSIHNNFMGLISTKCAKFNNRAKL